MRTINLYVGWKATVLARAYTSITNSSVETWMYVEQLYITIRHMYVRISVCVREAQTPCSVFL
jgi:hypothetical protein